jgi:hypothetical protein
MPAFLFKSYGMTMNKKKISITQVMRALHRDIGFLVVGLIIIYSVSGLVLVFRGTDLLKVETVIEKNPASTRTGLHCMAVVPLTHCISR